MVYQRIVKIEGVTVTQEGSTLKIKGKKGELAKEFRHPRVDIKIEDKELRISTKSEIKKDKAIVGTWAALIEGMITGVERGYTYTLKLIHTHFPITVKVIGNEIHMMNFLGEKFPRIAKINGDVKVNAQKESITVTGIDKYSVGQTAASIEKLSKNKRSKDSRIFQDGAYIIEKAKLG
ncbi:MAG: 50S ribosomal protein L6 [Nanoarchaeota archaeon]|nr:50S ribosomal protein L6 [Nanoarchaeota archaeon]MBU4300771.1 50S ribosomal protein L6 [Nanoarchaeota archaeon]MBU4452361.1 50S ribosomal protein L6 [Nanoarchaeota archaeon]MCG2723363.1 50S ribosomal protein L6 [archaeon]